MWVSSDVSSESGGRYAEKARMYAQVQVQVRGECIISRAECSLIEARVRVSGVRITCVSTSRVRGRVRVKLSFFLFLFSFFLSFSLLPAHEMAIGLHVSMYVLRMLR